MPKNDLNVTLKGIDKERINNFMGLTSEWEMKQIEEALLKSLGINK